MSKSVFLENKCLHQRKKNANKTFFELNGRLAITGLLLFVVAHILLITFQIGFKIINPSFIASDNILYFGNILISVWLF